MELDLDENLVELTSLLQFTITRQKTVPSRDQKMNTIRDIHE